MTLVFHLFFIILIDSVFCIIQLNTNEVNIDTNEYENFTLIQCKKNERKSLNNFAVPTIRLHLKYDIRFKGCDISNNFSISKLMHSLGIKVKKLTSKIGLDKKTLKLLLCEQNFFTS